MDTLWVIMATALIVVIGYAITTFVIYPIRDLQKVQNDILRLLLKYGDVYGLAPDKRKYQARQAFQRSVAQLDKASALIPLYWLWGALWSVPKQKQLDEAKAALQKLSSLAVQVIDHQPDLTKRQVERAQVTKEAAHQEKIVKICLRLKEYAFFRDL